MAFTNKYIRVVITIVITKNTWKRLAANHLRQIDMVIQSLANSVGIASSDHRICSLQFEAAVMLTGFILVLR